MCNVFAASNSSKFGARVVFGLSVGARKRGDRLGGGGGSFRCVPRVCRGVIWVTARRRHAGMVSAVGWGTVFQFSVGLTARLGAVRSEVIVSAVGEAAFDACLGSVGEPSGLPRGGGGVRGGLGGGGGSVTCLGSVSGDGAAATADAASSSAAATVARGPDN
jgi:hypothetical protein